MNKVEYMKVFTLYAQKMSTIVTATYTTTIYKVSTANVDLLKMVPVEILLNFGNYFRTLQLGF